MAKALEFLELDFYDPNDAIIALNFSSVDFREIGNNKGTHSKTIKMPSTKVNDTFFGMSFEATNEGLFDPTIKVPIQITDIEFYGTLQLKSIEIVSGTPVNYVVNIFGDLADWASLIGEKTLRQLAWHEGRSHRLDEATISSTWSKNGLNGTFIYPLISYGNFLQDRSPAQSLDVAFWRPGFFVLPLLTNIFKEIGYTFISDGIAKTPLRDAILPFTSKNVDMPSLKEESTSTASQDVITYVNGSSNSYEAVGLLEFPNTVTEGPNLFNNSTNKYSAPAQDSYNINLQIDVRIGAKDNKLFNRNELGSFRIEMRTDREGPLGLGGTRVEGLTEWKAYGDDEQPQRLVISTSVPLNKDELAWFTVTAVMKDKTELNIDVTSILSIEPSLTTLRSGDLLRHADIIQNSKQIDLVKTMLRLGNFRIITDNQRKTVEFVQESDFLLTRAEDWTDKVDESSPVTLSLIQNQGAKELEWNYSNDSSDGFIKDKEDSKDKLFAQKRISLDSEYRKGNQTVFSAPFSATVDYRGLGLTVPVMSTQDLKQGEPIEQGEFETGFSNRILIYGGLQDGNFIIDNVAKTQYPFAYFKTNEFSLKWDNALDDQAASTTTTSQGLSAVTFDSGLVDRYYQGAIKRLNKSKLYAGYFFLNDIDIKNLDFRKPKIINGVHYYLNKVIDYQLNTNKSTKVELISR